MARTAERRGAVGTSQTTVTYPIVAALVEAEKILGRNRVWRALNSSQVFFLQTVFPARSDIDAGRIACIESIANRDVSVINSFLKAHGFSVQLQPIGPGGFAVASVLDLLVEWLEAGAVTTVHGQDGVEYPAVRVKQSNRQISTVIGHQHPIVTLATRTPGVTVNLTVAEQQRQSPTADLELAAWAAHLSKLRQRGVNYGDVVFPMVDLNQEVDISWITGLSTMGDDGMPAIIAQALQQTKLKMNEKGARAQSAVAMAVTRGISTPMPPLVIDRPFLIWFEQEGLSQPLFVGHICEDAWKNPGNLS